MASRPERSTRSEIPSVTSPAGAGWIIPGHFANDGNDWRLGGASLHSGGHDRRGHGGRGHHGRHGRYGYPAWHPGYSYRHHGGYSTNRWYCGTWWSRRRYVYRPSYCYTVVDPWWYSSGWGVSYHDDDWSIWITNIWPSTTWCGTSYSSAYYVSGIPVVERYVAYETVPVVTYVDLYRPMDVLIDRLKYGNVDIRKEAARELGKTGSLRALYPLVYALEYDGEPLVRFYAARALGRLGFRDALPALARSIEWDAEEFVRVEAADAVEQIEEG